MKLPSTTSPNPGVRYHGFAMVTAIFLLVVIASLGTFILTISTASQRTSDSDIRGDRAYQAARAGVEWGLYKATQTTGYCTGAVSDTLPTLAGTLADYTVTVVCRPSSFVEGVTTTATFSIESTARLGTVGDAGFIERQVMASISK